MSKSILCTCLVVALVTGVIATLHLHAQWNPESKPEVKKTSTSGSEPEIHITH